MATRVKKCPKCGQPIESFQRQCIDCEVEPEIKERDLRTLAEDSISPMKALRKARDERDEARRVALAYQNILLKYEPGDLGISAVLAEFWPIYEWLNVDRREG